jgi:hypothetical protein
MITVVFAAAGATTPSTHDDVPGVAAFCRAGVDTVNLSVTDNDTLDSPLPGEKDPHTVSHELVLRRLSEAQPRIVATIETIIRARASRGVRPRAGIDPAEVRALLARPALARPTKTRRYHGHGYVDHQRRGTSKTPRSSTALERTGACGTRLPFADGGGDYQANPRVSEFMTRHYRIRSPWPWPCYSRWISSPAGRRWAS